MSSKVDLKIYLEGYKNVSKKAQELGVEDLDKRKEELENQIKKEENKKAEFNVATKTQPLHGSNLFACVDAVLAVELIDTSASRSSFLLACVE